MQQVTRSSRSIAWTAFLFCALIALGATLPAYAQSSSSNYVLREDTLGSGGGSGASSSYGIRDTVGGSSGIGVGEANSTNNSTETGNVTPDEPALAFSVDASSLDLGALTTATTKTGTVTFSVKNYVSSGYVVQVIGNTPSNGSHALTAMSTAAASSTGTEQFGLNVVANTSPVTFGADPVQQPDSTFGFGQAATGYNTTNMFKYVSGDVIALATESSGTTQFTISYIANISSSTPGGSYTGTQTLVVTGTY